MKKIFLLVCLLFSIPAVAQDYSIWNKNIRYSDTLTGAKTYKSIYKALKQPAEVYALNIWGQRDFQAFFENIHRFENLRKLVLLNFSGTNVELPADIWSLTKLEFLSLTNFAGANVGDVRNLRELKYLELDGIGFNEIPAGIFDLQKLEVLNLSCNRLSAIPPGIAKLTKLVELELTNNCLTGIPEGITYVPHLRYLVMNNTEKGAKMADGTTVCDISVTSYPAFLTQMKDLLLVGCYFKVEVDPELKQKMKEGFPWIRFE